MHVVALSGREALNLCRHCIVFACFALKGLDVANEEEGEGLVRKACVE